MKLRPRHKIGVVCRGGPHNGPFSAAFFRTFKPLLAAKGLALAGIYADSGSVPSAVLAAIGDEERACDTWSALEPRDIIAMPEGWFHQWRRYGMAAYNLMYSWSVFDSEPLLALIRGLMPTDRVFAPGVTPVTFAAVDYFTGKQLVFRNTDPRHRPRYHAGMMASMGLVPFLPPHVIVHATRDGIMDGAPYAQSGALTDVALGMDAGYVDNLLLELACQDGMDVVFVVDLNGLGVAPLGTDRPERWTDFLQRAFNVLVTTNDRRRLQGVQRTNEAIAACDEVRRVAKRAPRKLKARLERLASRMDRTLVGGRRKVQVHMVSRPDCAIAFDFASFTHEQADHLLVCGEKAALATAAVCGLVPEAP